MTDEDVLSAFKALYSGGLAQKRRDAGDASAMPPWAETYWLGKQVVKCPMDLWVYQELIVETRPELLIETGTSGGGSAFFFASLFDILGIGHVMTVDKDSYPHLWREHTRVTYLVGDSASEPILSAMREKALNRRTMVSLDSLHTREHVRKELIAYAPLVSSGCYLVIEDVHVFDHEGNDPAWGSYAVKEFATHHPEFLRDRNRERHLLTSNVWLRRQ